MDRVALVTGAAKRVGAAIVRELHRAGYNIAVHHRTSAGEAAALAAELAAARPDSALTLAGDLKDLAACRRIVDEARDRWGRLDLLVNNASVYNPTPLPDLDADAFDDIMQINLRAPLFLAKFAAPALSRTHGSIVNLTDIYAERPTEEHAVYLASKAGLAAVTTSLALDLAPDIRVNAVAPGAVLWPTEGADLERRERILERIPAGRPGDPMDIAQAVLYLARADYVTGHTLTVDGGRSLTI